MPTDKEPYLEVSLDIEDLSSAESNKAEEREHRVPGNARVERLCGD